MPTRVEIVKLRLKQAWIWMLRNDVFIYLLFVAIAMLFWWGRAMSSSREMTISIPIVYTDVPSAVLFDEPLPEFVHVTLRDNGKLLRQISNASSQVSISLADRFAEEEGVLVLSADVLRPKIQDILPGTTTIQLIRPELIERRYQRQEKKVVPVELVASWTLAKQYQLAEEPILKPAEIEIYGRSEVLDTIDAILTDSLLINDLQNVRRELVDIVIPQGVRASASQVEVAFVAEQFTEKAFTIPIELASQSENEVLHFFPREATVVVRVGVSHFSEVNASDIKAVCPYPTQGERTLPVEIVYSNPYIRHTRTNVREVEYIIER